MEDPSELNTPVYTDRKGKTPMQADSTPSSSTSSSSQVSPTKSQFEGSIGSGRKGSVASDYSSLTFSSTTDTSAPSEGFKTHAQTAIPSGEIWTPTAKTAFRRITYKLSDLPDLYVVEVEVDTVEDQAPVKSRKLTRLAIHEFMTTKGFAEEHVKRAAVNDNAHHNPLYEGLSLEKFPMNHLIIALSPEDGSIEDQVAKFRDLLDKPKEGLDEDPGQVEGPDEGTQAEVVKPNLPPDNLTTQVVLSNLKKSVSQAEKFIGADDKLIRVTIPRHGRLLTKNDKPYQKSLQLLIRTMASKKDIGDWPVQVAKEFGHQVFLNAVPSTFPILKDVCFRTPAEPSLDLDDPRSPQLHLEFRLEPILEEGTNVADVVVDALGKLNHRLPQDIERLRSMLKGVRVKRGYTLGGDALEAAPLGPVTIRDIKLQKDVGSFYSDNKLYSVNKFFRESELSSKPFQIPRM
jgi:hypothetical protein